MAKIDKSNEVEKPEQPVEGDALPGEKVAVTNPIVVYSDVPGAGPNDVPADDGKTKAVDKPAANKAVTNKETK